jgi:hypothetical protein
LLILGRFISLLLVLYGRGGSRESQSG